MASGVPERSPLLAAVALVDLACATAISIRLVAVSAVVAEALVVRAVLPADGTDARVAALAVGVAQGAILLLVLGARGERLASSAAVSLLPAGVAHIGVMVIMMEVVDGCTVVVLLGVGQGLF